jgi:alcohol dehydrogenase (NADP+)
MIESSDLRMTTMPLNNGAGHMPTLGFGTLIPDTAVTKTATRDALDAGFRHFDCAERYRNEREEGEALQAGLAAKVIEETARLDELYTPIPLKHLASCQIEGSR